jgi:hypothetical protein
MNPRAQSLLRTRLGQIASSGGLSGVGMRTRFVLSPRVTVLDATQTEGLQKLTTVRAEVAFEVQDLKSKSAIDEWTMTVAGTANDEGAAVVQALSSIKPGAKDLQDFSREIHDRIVAHYEKNCGAIRSEARVIAESGRGDEALASLLTVPVDAKACHADAMADAARIAKATAKASCTRALQEAQARKKAGDYAGAVERLLIAGSGSPCQAEADKLAAEIEGSPPAKSDAHVSKQLETFRAQQTNPSPATTVALRAVSYFNSAAAQVGTLSLR